MSVATLSDFSGLWIPLVTPFGADGAIDHAALQSLVARLAGSGIAGVVACGTTGEAAALSDAEQDEVLDAVLQAARSAAPGLQVAMGLSGYHLGHVLKRVRSWNTRALAGVLVAPPHYIRPCQQGLRQWFEAIAEASAHPLIVYDIPYRSAATLELATLLALAGHPNIRAVKDCGGDAAKTQALIADGRLQVLAGEDAHYDWQPYFFTDQYDLGMEYVGRGRAGDEVVIRGEQSQGEFICFWLREGVITAAMNVNIWDVNDRLRALVGRRIPPATLAAADTPLAEL